jgi:hypothetical protein
MTEGPDTRRLNRFERYLPIWTRATQTLLTSVTYSSWNLPAPIFPAVLAASREP